jgi:succinate dehydrogenase subunit C
VNSDPSNIAPAYTLYHPRWHRERVSTYWWLRQKGYLKFILREISSVFVAAFVVITLFQLNALRHGPEAYQHFQRWLRTPLALGINILCLGFVVFHTITWFNLAPHAIPPIKVAGRRLPAIAIAAPNFVLWALVSGVLIWAVLR